MDIFHWALHNQPLQSARHSVYWWNEWSILPVCSMGCVPFSSPLAAAVIFLVLPDTIDSNLASHVGTLTALLLAATARSQGWGPGHWHLLPWKLFTAVLVAP